MNHLHHVGSIPTAVAYGLAWVFLAAALGSAFVGPYLVFIRVKTGRWEI